MRRLLLVSIFVMTLVRPDEAGAVYNANLSGQIQYYWSYAEDDAIFFVLRNQPTTHPTCSPSFFVIDGTITADRRKMMFARLSLAYALQENVNIGYDNAGNRAEGYIRV